MEDQPEISVRWEGAETDAVLPTAFLPSIVGVVVDAEEQPPKDEAQDIKTLKRVWSFLERKKKNRPWTPSPIQLNSWPILLNPTSNSFNLIGIAATGSGKTFAYGIPMVISMASSKTSIHGLVLAPTRELAIQIDRELTLMVQNGFPSGSTDNKVVTVFGGRADREDQVSHLSSCQRVAMLVVATPGRLVDLMQQDKRVRTWLSTAKLVVLDEADRLAIHPDMAEQVTTILECVKKETRRICLYSATYPRSVHTQWNKWVNSPRVRIQVNTVSLGREGGGPGSIHISKIPSHVTQTLHVVDDSNNKRDRLLALLIAIQKAEVNNRKKGLCIIFFARIQTLQSISKQLRAQKQEVKCADFHGKLTQEKREKALANFRCGKIPILLATDIAARGIHVNNVEHVINYDFPDKLDQYVHRCGRAGRSSKTSKRATAAPKKAVVYSFFLREMATMAKDVVALLRASNAWIDPKLLELVDSNDNNNTKDGGGPEKKKKKRVEVPISSSDKKTTQKKRKQANGARTESKISVKGTHK